MSTPTSLPLSHGLSLSLSLSLTVSPPLSHGLSPSLSRSHPLQDIFICRSCGLTDSLCCCTECAYSCHRGHDCVFKKASPTAYCDCWERCSCKCLAQTPDSVRLSLLQKLMATTSLANKVGVVSPSLEIHLTTSSLLSSWTPPTSLYWLSY